MKMHVNEVFIKLNIKVNIMAFDFEAALKNIPRLPGIYIMKDARSNVFYVGKAKDLNRRIRQYASGHDDRAFVSLLHDLLHDIDVIITKTEQEALILEASYIKKERPRFNILLKDDKRMLQLRIDMKKEWPRVEIVRKRRKDNAHYFGPYPSAAACRRSFHVINRYFMLRTCTDTFFKNRVRPCLQYEIKRCLAPCVLNVDRDEYVQRCKEAMLFLSGKFQDLVHVLETKMFDASDILNFELAAAYRDQIEAIKSIGAEQKLVQKSPVHQDYIAFYTEGAKLAAVIMMVRDGRLMHMERYTTMRKVGKIEDVALQIITHHYQTFQNYPKELLLEPLLEGQQKLIASVLWQLSQSHIHVLFPKRGTKHRLLQIAQANVLQQFKEFKDDDSLEETLNAIQKALRLEHYPRRIESYDISNLQAGAMVGSMTVFIEGKLDASRCRVFKVRDARGQDDYSSLYEVMTRRMRYIESTLKEELGDTEKPFDEKNPEGEALAEDPNLASFYEVPDLLLIDGGKGQLNAAIAALDAMGLTGFFDIRAMGESRVLKTASPTTEHSPDRFYFPNESEPLVLAQDSPENLLLVRVRDETHKRALSFHRKKRAADAMTTRLDVIEGVGPKRKARLLQKFGSTKNIAMQSVEDLMEQASIPRNVAQRIIDVLGSQED